MEEKTPESIRESIIKELHTIYDPEIPVDIYQLGLIYDVSVEPDGSTSITMTLTSPMCPAAEQLPPRSRPRPAASRASPR